MTVSQEKKLAAPEEKTNDEVATEEYEYEEVSEEGSEEDGDDGKEDVKPQVVSKSVVASPVVVPTAAAPSSALLDSGREKALEYKRWVADVIKPSDLTDFDKMMARSAELCSGVKSCFKDDSPNSVQVRANMDELHASVVETLSARKKAVEAEEEERKKKREAALRGMEEAKLNAEQARHKRTLRSALMQKCQLIIQWIANTSAELKKARSLFPSPSDGEVAYLKAAPEVEESLNRLRASLNQVVAEVEEARVAYDQAPAGDAPAESGAALIDGQTKHAEDLLALHQQQFAALRGVILETELASHVEGLSKWCALTYAREDLFDDVLCASVMQEFEQKIASLEEAQARCAMHGAAGAAVVDVASFRSSMKNFLAERSSMSQKKKLEENVLKVEAEALCAAFVSWATAAAGAKPSESLRSASVEEVEEALEAHEVRMKEILAEGKEKIFACKAALKRAQKEGLGKLAYSEDGLESRLVELTSLLKRRTSSLQRMIEEAVEREEAERKVKQERVLAIQAWESAYLDFQRWVDAEHPRLLASMDEDESSKVPTELRERLARLQGLWDNLERLETPLSGMDRTMADAKFLGEKLLSFLADCTKRIAAVAAAKEFSSRVEKFVESCLKQQERVEAGGQLEDGELSLLTGEFDAIATAWHELLVQGHTGFAQHSLAEAEAAKSALATAAERRANAKDSKVREAYEAVATNSLRLMRAATDGMTLLDQRRPEDVSWESVLVEASFEVEKVLSFVNQCERDALAAWTALESADGTAQQRANPQFRVVQEAALEFREVARKKLSTVEASVQAQTRRDVASKFESKAKAFMAWINEEAAATERFHAFGKTVAEVDHFLSSEVSGLDETLLQTLSEHRAQVSDAWEKVRSCGVLGTADEPFIKWQDCVEAEHKLESAMSNRIMAAKVARSELLAASDQHSSGNNDFVAPSIVLPTSIVADLEVIVKERQLEREEKKSRRASVRISTPVIAEPVSQQQEVEEIVEEEIVEEIVVEEEEEEPLANFLVADVQFEDADLLDVFANIELDDLLKSIRHSAPVRDYFCLPLIMRKMILYLQSPGDLSQNLLEDPSEAEEESVVVTETGEVLPSIPAVVPGLPPPDELIERIVSPESEMITTSMSGGNGLTLQRAKVYILELFMNPLSGVVTEALCASDDVLDVLFSHWKKDPLVESMEDKNTLDLMAKMTSHLVAAHPRSFFRKLLNTPWLKARLMDLFHVKEVGDILRVMLDKEAEVLEEHRELGWSRDCLVPFVLKKLERGLAERIDVIVVDSCEFLAHLVLTHFRSKQYLVLEVLQSLSVVTSAFLDEHHYYQPELFALFFALVPNKQELTESSFSSEWENEQAISQQQQQQPAVQYPAVLVEFLTSVSLSDQLRTILSAVPSGPMNRLGVQRWRASQVVCCMVGTLHPEVVDVLISSGNLARVLDLFFDLPQSSMMHSMILDAIRFMLHHSPRLRHWLLVVYKFVERIGRVFKKEFDRSSLPTSMPNTSVHHLGHLYDAFCDVRAVQAEQSPEELEASQGWDGFSDLLASILAIEKLLDQTMNEIDDASRKDEALDDDTEQMLAAALLEEMMESEMITKDVSVSEKDTSSDAFADAVLAAAVAADSSLKFSDSPSEEQPEEQPAAAADGAPVRKRSWSARRQKMESEQSQEAGNAVSTAEEPKKVGDESGSSIAILAAPSSSRRSWKGRQVGATGGALKELENRYGEPKRKLADSLDLNGYGNSPFPLRPPPEGDSARKGGLRSSAERSKSNKDDSDDTDAILAAAAAADGKGSDDDTDAILAAAAAADGKGSDDDTDAILAAAAAEDNKGSDTEDDDTDAILAAAAAEDHKVRQLENEEHVSNDARASSSGQPAARRSWKTNLVQRQSKTLEDIGSRYSSGDLSASKQAAEEPSAAAVVAKEEPAPVPAEVAVEAPRRSWKERASARQSGSLSDLASRYKGFGATAAKQGEEEAEIVEAVAVSEESSTVRRSWRDKSSQKSKRLSVELVDDADSDAILAAAMAEDKALQALMNDTSRRTAEREPEAAAAADAAVASAVAAADVAMVAPVAKVVVEEAAPVASVGNTSVMHERVAAARAALEADKLKVVELQKTAQARISEAAKLDSDRQSKGSPAVLKEKLAALEVAKAREVELLVVAEKELQAALSHARDEEALVVSRDRLAAAVQEERRNNAKISDEITMLSEKRVVLERELSVQRSAAESAEAARAISLQNADEQEREQKRLRQELLEVESATKDMAAREPKLRAVLEQEIQSNKAELEDLTKDYTTEIDKLKERLRVANAMRILQQKREGLSVADVSTTAAASSTSSTVQSSEGLNEEAGMQCPACSTLVKKKGAKFCPKCRTALVAVAPVPSVVVVESEAAVSEAKKVVVGRRASMNMSAANKEVASKPSSKKAGTQRAKDPRRAPVTMQSLQGLLSAHQPCLMCSWYNPVGTESCGKCGARLKE